MMLANPRLRVSMVTSHLPLSDVPRALTAAEIFRAVEHTASALRSWWGIAKPRIAVCALNPHAGEGGLLGTEERDLIIPALAQLRRRLARVAEISGPHPSDTLFAQNDARSPRERYDAVVAMYHDQGLIPVKLLDFPGTVNVSLGLPMIRTSVDHGVAFDLVGTGRADPTSFQQALALAAQLVKTGSSTQRGKKS
jgi:4-hydroxythreonine-4-phosphate dehydrogenase